MADLRQLRDYRCKRAPPATQLRPKDHPDRTNQWCNQADADVPSWRMAERSCSSLEVALSPSRRATGELLCSTCATSVTLTLAAATIAPFPAFSTSPLTAATILAFRAAAAVQAAAATARPIAAALA